MAKTLWRRRARSLEKARGAIRQAQPEGLHDLRVALRRAAVTAEALGKKKVARRSRSLASSLSDLRQMEIDRQLLRRVRALNVLSEEAASGLEARWDALHASGMKKAVQLSQGKKLRRLLRRLRRREESVNTPVRLELERRRAERRLAPPSDDAPDRDLHRYRLAIKKARYLAEDLAACGARGREGTIAREKELQDALGRWNDLRLFRERLKETRAEAEEHGTVTLAVELDHLISALEGTVAQARQDALTAARRLANVIPFLERSA